MTQRKKFVQRALSIAVAASMCLSLCIGAFAASVEGKSTPSQRFAEQIQTAQEKGLMVGYGNGVFGGNDTLTRAMWVTILENMCNGIKSVNSSKATSFTDVSSSDWFADGVAWAVLKGITDGYPDGTFRGNEVLSRQELAQMAYQYAIMRNLDSKAYTEVKLDSYKDGSEVSDWAKRAYRWALANKILLPLTEDVLEADGEITRAEAANAAVALSNLKVKSSSGGSSVNVNTSTTVAYSRIAYAISTPTAENGIMSVEALMAGGQVPLTTKELDEDVVVERTKAGSDELISEGTFLDVSYNSKGEVIEFTKLFSLSATNSWFDTVKYGAEFAPVKGEAGNAIASGWILDKSADSIVVGDTNHFEETYKLAEGVKVYELNTETKQLTEKTLADMPVTEKTNGKYSLTPNRQVVVAVFDRNYKDAENAEVTELYYVTPQAQIAEKYLLEEYDTMAQYSYFPDTETNGVLGKPMATPWIAYTKPFTIVEDKMHYVGDNDVACYLFETDSGLALLDTGWPSCGYVYYQAIEEAGFDPREIKYLLLSHGHGDHYGTANQFHEMITNAGGDVKVYETFEDSVGYAKYGFPEIGATIPDIAVLNIIDEYYTWEEWMDFGGGVRLYPILTPGHTNGTGSFIFEVTPDGGEPVTFGYMGGFGTIHTPDQGYRRTQFVYGLRYLQQHVEVDYSLPQHVAHFPMLEINKAAEIKGISFLEAMVPGNDEWCNFLERRMVAQEMQLYHDKFAEDPTIQVTFPDGTVKEFETQKAAPKLVSNEKGGPWKRDAGEYQITLVDGGKLLHGFNVLENPNPLLDGVYNSNGDNLGDGVMITRDGYMHDPDKWFIQISVHVDDDYDGQFTDLEGALNGPVESLYGEDWHEIVRTQYFNSKEEAEAFLALLQEGQTYTVQMDKNSNILLADSFADTFKMV